MEDRKTLLQIRDLSVEFQTAEGVVHAVNELSYELLQGETLGIVGESGSGKSVSSLAAMQLISKPAGRIVKGEILYEGKDLVQCTEKEMEEIRGNDISMIFQEPMTSLNPILTCGSQIAEVLRTGYDEGGGDYQSGASGQTVSPPDVRRNAPKSNDCYGSGLPAQTPDCR